MTDTDRLTQTQGLGAYLSEHLRNTGRNLGFILLLAASGIVAILAGPLMGSRAVSGGVCVSSVGLLLVVLALWSGYVARRDRDLRVRLYEGGLVQRRGGHETVLPWEDVASVNHTVMQSRRAGVVGRTTHLCTLQTRTNRKMQFSDATLQNVSDLCRVVQERTLAPLLRDAATTLREGGTIPFGKLSANSSGVDTGRETIPWTQIRDVRIDNGFVALAVDGKWRNIATTGRVTNVHVLFALVRRAKIESSGG
ncbi:MAG: hypothetical protein JXC32_06960 [Anaerolineae bacterium]|nr:hypothetical protein [Anaerolineae bacterium]